MKEGWMAQGKLLVLGVTCLFAATGCGSSGGGLSGLLGSGGSFAGLFDGGNSGGGDQPSPIVVDSVPNPEPIGISPLATVSNPEPASAALFGGGLAGMAWWRRRRKAGKRA